MKSLYFLGPGEARPREKKYIYVLSRTTPSPYPFPPYAFFRIYTHAQLPFVSEKWQAQVTCEGEKQTLEKLMGVCWRGKLDFPSTTIHHHQPTHLTPHTAGEGRG